MGNSGQSRRPGGRVWLMKTKIARRGLIRLAEVFAGIGAIKGTFGVAGDAVAQPVGGSPAQRGIEPNTIKRRGAGFRGYDPDRAFPGFTLFAASVSTNRTVYLTSLPWHVAPSCTMRY